jgi:mono/diheme cytochrome c family protein
MEVPLSIQTILDRPSIDSLASEPAPTKTGMFHPALVVLLLALAGFFLAACATAPSGNPVPQSPALDGAALYAEHCAGCHGGTGRGGSARRIAGKPAWETSVVVKARVGPMSQVRLSAEEADAVAKYVAGLK